MGFNKINQINKFKEHQRKEKPRKQDPDLTNLRKNMTINRKQEAENKKEQKGADHRRPYRIG